VTTKRVEMADNGTEYDAARRLVIEALDATDEFVVAVEEAIERINQQIEELEQEKEDWLDAADVLHSKLQEWFGEGMIPGHID